MNQEEHISLNKGNYGDMQSWNTTNNRTYVSITDSISTLNIMREYWREYDDEFFIAYDKDRSPDKYMCVGLCGFSYKLNTKYYVLNNVAVADISTVDITKYNTNENDIINSTLARSYLGEKILMCKRLFSSTEEGRLHKHKKLYSNDISCQELTIETLQPCIRLKPYSVRYIADGKGRNVGCGDRVDINIHMKDKNNKTLLKKNFNNILIGHGIIPLQIERSIMNVRKGGHFVITINSKDLINASGFSIDEKMMQKSLMGSQFIGNALSIEVIVKNCTYDNFKSE